MKIAFVFPGQGSQSMGMLARMATIYPLVKATFAEASAVLDVDLWQLAQQGPEAELNKTEFAQPLLLAASVALWRVWQAQNGTLPVVLAGHSLGEYSALVCADALDFAVAIKLVRQRGQFMQQAVALGTGAMAAIIGLTATRVQQICKQVAAGEVVVPANFNAPAQVVIAGHAKAVQRASELAKVKGARKVVSLSVSVPSHCALMQPAADALACVLQDVTVTLPHTPCINNVAVAIEYETPNIKTALVQQLTSPVRWVETVEKMIAMAITHVVECGPGRVLTGLNKRIDKNCHCATLNSPETLTTLLRELA